MTSAALIVIVVAGSFAFADIVLIKALGLGIAIAVALDATVVRALLVPGDDAPARATGTGGCPARSSAPAPALEDEDSSMRRPRAALAVVVVLAVVVAGVRRRPDPRQPAVADPSPRPTPPPDAGRPTRIPVVLPRDDGPHDRLTEWWYYTGHLADEPTAGRFGFEAVVFRAERGSVPAVAGRRTSRSPTRPAAGSSTRSGARSAPQVDRSPRGAAGEPTGFDLPGRRAWTRTSAAAPLAIRRAVAPGRLERRRPIQARSRPRRRPRPIARSGWTSTLASTKPPALHDGDGFVDFGPAGLVLLLLAHADGRDGRR